MEKVEDREWRSEKEAVSGRQGVEKDGRPVGKGLGDDTKTATGKTVSRNNKQ